MNASSQQLLASLDAQIDQLTREREQARTEAERAHIRAQARELGEHVDDHIETLVDRNAQIDQRKAEMVREHPVLRSRATRRRALRGKPMVLRGSSRRSRSSHGAQPGHRRTTSTRAGPDDDPSEPPPPLGGYETCPACGHVLLWSDGRLVCPCRGCGGGR